MKISKEEFLKSHPIAPPDSPIFKEGVTFYTLPEGWAEKRRKAMAQREQEKAAAIHNSENKEQGQ